MTESSPNRRLARKMQFGLGTLLLWTAVVGVYLGCCRMSGIDFLSFTCITLWIIVLGIVQMMFGELGGFAAVLVWAAVGAIRLVWLIIANLSGAPEWISGDLSGMMWRQSGEAWFFGSWAYIFLSAAIRAAYRLGNRDLSSDEHDDR